MADALSRFDCEYSYKPRHGSAVHSWRLTGARVAIELHITGLHRFDGVETWGAGLEAHYRSPPAYMANQAPSHRQCWLLGCPCWHHGTSLYAQDVFLPAWQVAPHDHEGMFRRLAAEYRERMEGER